MAKVSTKEIFFRQWFASKYGNRFENHGQFNLPKGIADLDREYQSDVGQRMQVSFNFSMDKLRKIQDEVRATGSFDLFVEEYNSGLLEGVDTDAVREFVPEAQGAGGFNSTLEIPKPMEYELNITTIDDMEFPEFRLHRTGQVIDRLMSDHTEEGGLYGGTVIIVTGESGVGKSTLLIDYLAKLKSQREIALKETDEYKSIKKEAERAEYLVVNGFKPLYVSTEMTKGDIYFYKEKMPQIGVLPTLLAADYMRGGLKEVIEKAFKEDYDVILLDSYQDLVEKLRDMYGWKSTYSENFLIQLMVEAAERKGTAVLAIQHLTKGGEYVGRTFLKHTTTAMLEMRFDGGGKRFLQFSKNRRGGTMMHKPLYFTLDKVDKEIKYDAEAFDRMLLSDEVVGDESKAREAIDNSFNSVFDVAKEINEENAAYDPEDENEDNLS